MASQLLVMLKQNSKRANFAQIVKLNDDVLSFYDIWKLDSNPEDISFSASKFAIGSLYVARILRIDKKTNLAFITLGTVDAVMRLKAGNKFTEGQYILTEIITDGFADKNLRVQYVGDVPKSLPSRPALYRAADNLAQYCIKLAQDGNRQIICDDFAFIGLLKRHADNLDIIVPTKIKNSLFEDYDLAEQIDMLSCEKVGLNNGGNIIIEQCHAMTVVDVNSGTYTGDNSAKMVDEINQQAANMLCEQLLLRNISGLVIVDFLKYKRKADKQKFMIYLQKLIKNYKFELGTYSVFGLAEFKITRKSKSLEQKLLDIV